MECLLHCYSIVLLMMIQWARVTQKTALKVTSPVLVTSMALSKRRALETWSQPSTPILSCSEWSWDLLGLMNTADVELDRFQSLTAQTINYPLSPWPFLRPSDHLPLTTDACGSSSPRPPEAQTHTEGERPWHLCPPIGLYPEMLRAHS